MTHPLLLTWGHSMIRPSAGWALRVGWPAEWLRAHRGIDVADLDEQSPARARRDPTVSARVNAAAPGPVLSFGGWALDPLVVRRQRAAGYHMVAALDDDYWSIPEWQSQAVGTEAARDALAAVLRESSVVVTTTAALADRVRPFARAVTVIPNALPVDRIALAERNVGPKVRVLWAGTATHAGDLAVVRPALDALCQRYSHVRLVLLTKNPPSWLQALGAEVHRPVDFARYYATLARLRPDLAIAPLVDHPFNESKSNLKALDYAALGLPAVLSRVGPYRELPDGVACVTIADNNPAAWLEALSELVEDAELRRTMGAAARAWVERTGSLDAVGPAWARVLSLPAPSPVAPAVPLSLAGR